MEPTTTPGGGPGTPMPAAPPAPGPPHGGTTRPGGLLAVLILAVVLGGGGACSGAMGIVGTLMQGAMTQAQGQLLARTGDPALAELQEALAEQIAQAQRAYLPLTLADAALGLGASILLLAGAVLCFSYRERGRRLLLFGMGFGAAAALVSTGIELTVQTEIMGTTFEALGGVASAPGMGSAHGIEQLMDTTATVVRVLVYVFAIGWLVLKCTYFAVSAWYLRRAEVRALFGTDV